MEPGGGGIDVARDASVERAAPAVLERGRLEGVLVSLGMAGAMLVTRDHAERIWAPMVPIVSRVGAGDSTAAGCVLALARGAALADAVRCWIAAGSAAVMTPGTEMCRRADAERRYQYSCRASTTPGFAAATSSGAADPSGAPGYPH